MSRASRRICDPVQHPTAASGHLKRLIEQADEHYRSRGRPKAGELAASTSEWEAYLAAQQNCLGATPTSYELEWRLSRALFLEGEASPALYACGATHGRRAIQLGRARVEGYFWAGVNMALHAQSKRGPRGALALLSARRALGRACRISAGYHGGGPLRVLGRLEHKTPRLLGGSLARSAAWYELCLAIAPTNTVTLIYVAELEIERKNLSRAVRLLESILTLPVDPEWEFENIRDKTLARSMLDRLGTGTNGDR